VVLRGRFRGGLREEKNKREVKGKEVGG